MKTREESCKILTLSVNGFRYDFGNGSRRETVYDSFHQTVYADKCHENTHKPSVGNAQLFIVDKKVPLYQKKMTMQSIKKIVFSRAVASDAMK